MHKELKRRFTVLNLDQKKNWWFFDKVLWSKKAFKAVWSSLPFPFQQRVSGDKSFVRKDTCNLAKNLFQSFFLVQNDQTKDTWKLTKQHELFWPITCFKFVFEKKLLRNRFFWNFSFSPLWRSGKKVDWLWKKREKNRRQVESQHRCFHFGAVE